MRHLKALVLCVLAACGGDDSSSGGKDAGADASDSTFKVTGILQDVSTAGPVADAEVCVNEFPAVTCVHTDATGHYVLAGIPKGVRFHLAWRKQGYQTLFHFMPAQTADIQKSTLIFPKSVMDGYAQVMGTTLDPAKGILSMQVGPAFVGTTFTMTPTSGIGPKYTNAQDMLDVTLNGTSSFGAGGWLNVEPGTYEGVAHPPSGTCSFRVPGAAVGSAEIHVFAGAQTHVNFDCQ
jgi:hypothetical protein